MSDARSMLRQHQQASRIERPHAAQHPSTASTGTGNGNGTKRKLPDSPDETGPSKRSKDTRRSSTTPSQGVEVSIPSRPATPLDAEWAAFEADIAAASAPYDQDAVVASAPAMSAAAAAAAATEKTKPQSELDVEDEKEDAALALQDEFDEMKSLEDRVQRLKRAREQQLLKQRTTTAPETAVDGHAGQTGGQDEHDDDKDDEDEDEDEEDDEDDWASFRFKR